MLLLLCPGPSWSESAFERGRRHGIGAVWVNTVVACLYADKWIVESQLQETMSYYQAKYRVTDRAMAAFANHPNYTGAIDSTIANFGGCETILDKELLDK